MSLAHDNTTRQTMPLEVLDLLGHGICLVDSAGMVTRWNGRLQRLGVSAAEAEGRPVMEVLRPRLKHAWQAETIGCTIERVAAGAAGPLIMRSIEMAFPSAPRQVFHLVISPAADGGCALVLEDVTRPMRLREQYERILDSSPDGVFVVDMDRKIRMYNRACAEITGRAPEEILDEGCECAEVIHCHTEQGESLAQGLCPAKSLFRGDLQHQREEMLLTNTRGEERWIETTYSPVLGEDGKVEFVVGILRDVHDRKLLEDRLHQTEKLASLGQLVAGIAHEIKNPLAIILSSMDVLENPTRPQEQRAEASSFIREEVKRIDDRLRSFLAFARPRPVQPRPMLLSGVLRKRLAALEPLFPNVAFQFGSSAPEPIIAADAEQIEQVLTNLVLNAAEAMAGRGTIHVRTRAHNDVAMFEVEDDGPGIPPEMAARVFDPFFTTKTEGTGLGLSICYQIVLAHRGSIGVSRGRQGSGALFTVRLPMTSRLDAVAER